MCVSVGVHCTQVSGGLRMSFMSQLCVFWRSNSGHQACVANSLAHEPSYQPGL